VSDVGRFAREIVAKRVAILAAIPVLYGLLVATGVTMPWSSDQVLAGVGTALTILAALVGILWARKDVTPTDPALNPSDKQGRALTP
jgi:protein-S-isoprenylcysteine O-methyltransferase Ste14